MINGVINVYKEKGFTSHDVVAKLRGIMKQKRIGHTGTLDPDAVGVLPVCLGSATKLCEFLTDKTKEYEAELLLGVTTDTQDMTGTILTRQDVSVAEAEAEKVILSFIGKSGQIPPMYSAVKVNGKKLYELAREGKEVERKERLIDIFELEIIQMSLPLIKIRVKCSKGTYIRTLCHDIGQKIGCGAAMQSLVRTEAGSFLLKEALTLSEIERLKKKDELEEKIIPVDFVLAEYAACIVKNEFKIIIENGNSFYRTQISFAEGEENEDKSIHADGQQIRVYDEDGRFYGVYKWKEEEERYVPVKMFLGT